MDTSYGLLPTIRETPMAQEPPSVNLDTLWRAKRQLVAVIVDILAGITILSHYPLTGPTYEFLLIGMAITSTA